MSVTDADIERQQRGVAICAAEISNVGPAIKCDGIAAARAARDERNGVALKKSHRPDRCMPWKA
jgi:hypothetical protein